MKIYTDNTCIFDMTSSSGGKFDLKIGKIFKKLYSLEVCRKCKNCAMIMILTCHLEVLRD